MVAPRTPLILGMALASGLAVLIGVAVGVVMLGLSGASAALPVAVVIGLGGLAALSWYRGPQRRLWLALLCFVAPFDISKALIPPLDRFYSPGLYLSLGHMMLLVLTGVWLTEHVLVRGRALPLTRLDKLALLFLLWVWVSALRAPGNGLINVGSAMAYSLCVLAYYVVSHAVADTRDVALMLKALVAGLALQALHVAAQMATHSFLLLPGSKVSTNVVGNLLTFGGAGSAFRPIGAFEHPNALADYVTLLLAPALAFVLMGPRRIARPVWWTALAVLAVAGGVLLLTLSRGGWAAFAVAVLVIGTVFTRRRVIGSTHLLGALLAGLVALAALVMAYPQAIMRLTEPDDRSTESRVLLTEQAWTIIQAHPVIGVGFGAYNRAAHEAIPPSFASISPEYQAQLLQLVVHNHYLLVAAQMGIPALLGWVALLWCLVRQAWPLHRWRDPGSWALGVGLAAALASQMLFLASDNYDADIRVFMLWMTAGLLQAMTRLSDLPPAGAWPGEPEAVR